MNYDNIRSDAEQTARKMTSFLFIVSIIICIIIAAVGIRFLANGTEKDNFIGYIILFVDLILLFWSILYQALIDTFINISVKLNPLQELLWKAERIESNLNRLTQNNK